MLILNNPSLAHIAGPGSQGSLEATGLRLMHRSTVPGQHCPTKKTNLEYFCEKHKPFQEGYCLYSLKVLIFVYGFLHKIYVFYISQYIKSILKFHCYYRDQYSIHDMVNLKRLRSKENDVKTFTRMQIWQQYQMRNGIR